MEHCGKLLIEQYRTKVPEQALREILMTERKLREETYQDYAQRLLEIASGLPDGLHNDVNVRPAMQTFISRAYPKYTDELRSYELRLPISLPAKHKLPLLIQHLSTMACSDGNLPQRTYRTEGGAK